MFHFPTFPPHALCVQARVTPHDWCGVPPFGHPRINARLAAPRGLSQPPTSFIGSWCPGIHRVPLPTWPHNTTHPPHPTPGQPRDQARTGGPQLNTRVRRKMLASTVQFSTTHQQPPHHTPPARAPARRYETGTALTETATPPPHRGRACSLRTQQRAYHQHHPTSHPPHPPPTGGRAVLATNRTAPAELVSVPPTSTTPDTPRPPDNRRTVAGPGMTLDRTPTQQGPGQRSLERR